MNELKEEEEIETNNNDSDKNTESSEQKEEKQNPKIRLSRIKRIFIFSCFFIIQLLNCSDGGVVSAKSNQIKEELQIDDQSFGIYGSIVQIGRIIGTFSVMFLLNLLNRKYLIFMSLLVKCSSFLIYFFTSNFIIIMIFRFLQGFSHVFTYVYFPTWVDQFGLQKYKTLMTSFIQIASPFGSVLGFNLTTFLNNFKYGFAVLAFSILPLNISLIFMKSKYFSKRIFFYKTITENVDSRQTIYSLFEIDEERMKRKSKKDYGKSVWTQLYRPIFATIVLARTVLMFSFMGTHYWIGDYFQNVLGEDGKLAKSSIYSLVSLLGPFSGSMVGAGICEYFGGYTNKHSSIICFIFSIFTGITAIFIPIVDSLTYFTILLFLFFFFANCMMPILIGISFNCVDKKIRGASYGINSLLCTFLGNLPSPSVYGFINSRYKDINKRVAMSFNLNYVWINIILISFNYYFRLKEKKGDDFVEEVIELDNIQPKGEDN